MTIKSVFGQGANKDDGIECLPIVDGVPISEMEVPGADNFEPAKGNVSAPAVSYRNVTANEVDLDGYIIGGC